MFHHETKIAYNFKGEQRERKGEQGSTQNTTSVFFHPHPPTVYLQNKNKQSLNKKAHTYTLPHSAQMWSLNIFCLEEFF